MRMNRFLPALVVLLALVVGGQILAPADQQKAGPWSIPFELNSNKVYLRVALDVKETPYWFILDSGCPITSIDLDLARKLELPISGLRNIDGAGTGASEVGHTKVSAVRVGGVTFKPEPAWALKVHAVVSPYEGRAIDGLIGGDFFERHVVEIDYARSQLRVWPAAGFEYKGAGTVLALQRLGGHVAVEAEAQLPNGQKAPGLFVVDTGLRMGVAFNAPFVARHKLIEQTGAKLQATVGGGIGGEVVHHVGRLQALRLGNLTVDAPVVTFSQERTGALASDEYAGIIGADILRRYRVTFDYSRNRLILEPHPDAPKSYEFDMSGLFLIAEGDGFRTLKVRSVIAGSPAAQAGVQPGDILTAVDGVSGDRLTLEKARRSFLQEGTTHKLLFQRDGQPREVTLVLKRLV
jgi:hypothetical protein